MKTNNVFTEEFYKKLYDEIINYADENYSPQDEDDCYCNMEVQVGNFTVELDATFEVEYIDDSFDHAFGTYHDYHYEAGYLEEISIIDIWESNEENDLEDKVTDLFDEEKFWEQFKQYGTKSGIKPGDEVIARLAGRYGREVTATYQYTDTMRLVHVCKCSWQIIKASSVRLPKPDESKKF